MALQHEPFRFVQLARLAQDLFGDCELAQVVEARGETCQLDLRLVAAEAERDPRGQLADALRVGARVRVPGVDGLRERRGGAVARGTVRRVRELLQLCELDLGGLVYACAVLTVLLGPVERRV